MAVSTDVMIEMIGTSTKNFSERDQVCNWKRFKYRIDFVLAYNEKDPDSCKEKREFFENNLQNVGFIIENQECQKVNFVIIHTPKEVLIQYAEAVKIRLPIKQRIVSESRDGSLLKRALNSFRAQFHTQKFPPTRNVLSAEFSNDKDYLFDLDLENVFSTSARTEIVSYILHREKFSQEEQDQGIKKLLNDGVYKAAYPLHDGNVDTEGSQRKLLYVEWAKIRNCFKFQPIDIIKEYFGVKIGLYFTWLGFYTIMLIPASVVGLVCFLYGLSTLSKDTLVKEICNSAVIMCPLCDKNCDYWKLSDTCTYSKVVHVVDNSATIFFTVFMSFWAALYLQFWKRYNAEVTHKWGLNGFGAQCEPPRPKFLKNPRILKIKKVKRNIFTRKEEPHIPFWRIKLPSICLSFSVAVFWVSLPIAVVFGIAIYRMAFLASHEFYGHTIPYMKYVLPITAGIFNLIVILILNFIYKHLAKMLTEMELWRTQTEYDDSLTLKIYMFKFVNYYSSIFYIAFLKGNFFGYPSNYNRIFGFRREECNPGGCLVELTIQLCILMIGKQVLHSLFGIMIPFLYKTYNSIRKGAGFKKMPNEETILRCNHWTEDYNLLDLKSFDVYKEYLKIVLQYGFILIFVPAFPLAPLFALINNIFGLRLDAKKLIMYYRRPVPQRVCDIGVWLPIMDFIGRVAVISNAFIIGFTSHFIPKLIYYYIQNDRNDMYGYLNFTLSHFDVQNFSYEVKPQTPIYDVKTCSYMDFRNPPSHKFKYERHIIFWKILVARLVFVVVYQNVVGLVISVVQWVIPDVPKKLVRLIQQENSSTNEIILKHEIDSAKLRVGYN